MDPPTICYELELWLVTPDLCSAGERCEIVKEMCQTNRQCQNGGSCVDGQCVCTPGHMGLNCEESKYKPNSEQRSPNDICEN